MVKAIIFDMDDTLYPEMAFVESGFKAVSAYIAKKTGIFADRILDALWQEFNLNKRGVFDRLLNCYDGFSVEELVEVYRTHTPKIKLSSDAIEILIRMRKACKCRIGVLTDGPAKTQINKFSALGLEEYVDAVLFTDILGQQYWKPSTKGFLCILEILRVLPQDTVYVGDNPTKDFVAPNILGMISVFVKRKEGLYVKNPAPLSGKPHYTISSLMELMELFPEAF
ncbi:Haloacid dehalogenase domain protein hydrolase [Desulfofundulus kuznetsovii DSM 6115]|uniref:Haloacid dehalogenase domain protein hydrolase n=1 Tax=Desulfofundulus kuznetsovii (strain DSM 6115 / VKM B-1805 / 17) TaxID=760568 RepID=A0AAU8PI25_DESK7|nr:Haloacid dehalogenase domain protein hydrolase [Desulfofundulus kuznetsovii DSM 6115]